MEITKQYCLNNCPFTSISTLNSSITYCTYCEFESNYIIMCRHPLTYLLYNSLNSNIDDYFKIFLPHIFSNRSYKDIQPNDDLSNMLIHLAFTKKLNKYEHVKEYNDYLILNINNLVFTFYLKLLFYNCFINWNVEYHDDYFKDVIDKIIKMNMKFEKIENFNNIDPNDSFIYKTLLSITNISDSNILIDVYPKHNRSLIKKLLLYIKLTYL